MTLPAGFITQPLAHRGYHDASDHRPENSIAALQAAIDRGYGIEIDVQQSADGAAMVFHDYALDRLTEAKGPIRLRRAQELSTIPLVGGDTGIPTLADVLAFVAGRVPLLVELKDQDGGMGDDIGRVEEAVARDVAGYAGPLALMSFNPNSVALMARLAPDRPRGIVTSAYRYHDWPLPRATCDHLRDIPDYDRCGASFISHEVDDLTRTTVVSLRARGAKVLCWTVRSALQESAARKLSDNITFEGYAAATPA